MSLSVIMTIYDRPASVIRSVLASFAYFIGNDCYDEIVVVNDRGDRAAIENVLAGLKLEARIIDIAGPPGKRCPAVAWNAGFRAARSTHFYCISSDTVQIPNSVERARQFSEILPEMIVFGRAEHCGRYYAWQYRETQWRTMTYHFSPRPLGFVWMLPRIWLDRISPPGYDEAYMDGFCYEDTDIVMRLIKGGAEFLFSDDICGFHIEHGRQFLMTDSGLAMTKQNEDLFVSKYGAKNAMDLAVDKLYILGPATSAIVHSEARAHEVAGIIKIAYDADKWVVR